MRPVAVLAIHMSVTMVSNRLLPRYSRKPTVPARSRYNRSLISPAGHLRVN